MIEKYSDLDESECKILCNRIAKYLDLEVKEEMIQDFIQIF